MSTSTKNAVKLLPIIDNYQNKVVLYTELDGYFEVNDKLYIMVANQTTPEYAVLDSYNNTGLTYSSYGYTLLSKVNNSLQLDIDYKNFPLSGQSLTVDNCYIGRIYIRNAIINKCTINGTMFNSVSLYETNILNINWIQGIIFNSNDPISYINFKSKYSSDYLILKSQIVNFNNTNTVNFYYTKNNNGIGTSIINLTATDIYSSGQLEILNCNIYEGTFNYCNISVSTTNTSNYIYNGLFNNCEIGDYFIIEDGTYINTTLSNKVTWNGGNWNYYSNDSNNPFQAIAWNGGNWYNGTFPTTSIWLNGRFNNGIFNGTYWDDGNFNGGKFLGSNWNGGNFNNGIFTDSVWLKGTFSNGNLINSIWKNGTFLNGQFSGSTWFNGNFDGGTFIESTWNSIDTETSSSIFNGGVFSASTWNGGQFIDGTVINSIWNNGTFNGGYFISSTWNNGNFYNGSIFTSTWMNGQMYFAIVNGLNWSSGTWYDGIATSLILSGGTWYNGIFNSGSFSNSTWYNGSFNNGNFNGIWINGNFYGGVFNGLWSGGTFYSGTIKSSIPSIYQINKPFVQYNRATLLNTSNTTKRIPRKIPGT